MAELQKTVAKLCPSHRRPQNQQHQQLLCWSRRFLQGGFVTKPRMIGPISDRQISRNNSERPVDALAEKTLMTHNLKSRDASASKNNIILTAHKDH